MKSIKILQITIVIILLLFISCSDDFKADETTTDVATLDIQELKIPKGFDYSTQQKVNVTIIDDKKNVKYDVYAYSDKKYFTGIETSQNEEGLTVTDSIFSADVLNNLVFSGVPYNGILTQNITIPKYYNHIYIIRNDQLKFSSSIIKIINQEVNYNHSTATKKINGTKSGKTSGSIVNDYLYCVNGAAELFQIDPLSGALTNLSKMPMGSYTCGIDQANKALYSIGKSSPYPLMKYSIENNTWQTIANIKIDAPRLDYNYRDGLLYVSTGNNLYSYDPTNGIRLKSWKINGLHSTSGGDLAFAEDGTLFLCSFSGLYRLNLDANNVYQSTRISSDNLPFQPTSMTFDSNNELWLSNNASSSDLIVMDTQTGGWKYKYGVNANNNSNFNKGINDLTTFKIYTQTLVDLDSDGDGIIDRNDTYPDDNNKAFEVFTPSKYGWGTVSFEDLWPTSGDYDFNDLAINYRAIAIINAQNLAVQLDLIIKVKSNGASYTNGFGIEIESLIPSQIKSVLGTVLTQGYIKQNANGTEMNQDKAVVILFDNSHSMLNKEITISIKFNQPISTNDLGPAPFNPFIIINKIRENEVHLPRGHTTSLGKNITTVAGVNRDKDGDYLTDNGLPWAINIVHDFKTPKEKVSVNKAYNYFNQWATSGGTEFQDWYKDNPGNRNDALINK